MRSIVQLTDTEAEDLGTRRSPILGSPIHSPIRIWYPSRRQRDATYCCVTSSNLHHKVLQRKQRRSRLVMLLCF